MIRVILWDNCFVWCMTSMLEVILNCPLGRAGSQLQQPGDQNLPGPEHKRCRQCAMVALILWIWDFRSFIEYLEFVFMRGRNKGWIASNLPVIFLCMWVLFTSISLRPTLVPCLPRHAWIPGMVFIQARYIGQMFSKSDYYMGLSDEIGGGKT